jgi:hypothetical protein
MGEESREKGEKEVSMVILLEGRERECIHTAENGPFRWMINKYMPKERERDERRI